MLGNSGDKPDYSGAPAGAGTALYDWRLPAAERCDLWLDQNDAGRWRASFCDLHAGLNQPLGPGQIHRPLSEPVHHHTIWRPSGAFNTRGRRVWGRGASRQRCGAAVMKHDSEVIDFDPKTHWTRGASAQKIDLWHFIWRVQILSLTSGSWIMCLPLCSWLIIHVKSFHSLVLGY